MKEEATTHVYSYFAFSFCACRYHQLGTTLPSLMLFTYTYPRHHIHAETHIPFTHSSLPPTSYSFISPSPSKPFTTLSWKAACHSLYPYATLQQAYFTTKRETMGILNDGDVEDELAQTLYRKLPGTSQYCGLLLCNLLSRIALAIDSRYTTRHSFRFFLSVIYGASLSTLIRHSFFCFLSFSHVSIPIDYMGDFNCCCSFPTVFTSFFPRFQYVEKQGTFEVV
ncbi:hypothetical protein BDQ17DRAFT_929535 [Cyathus striatus]|nr:hypothetical protein BDQ17DRAFT_929535 [Cyathus striatus]